MSIGLLDPVLNFAKCPVSTGYASGAVTIVLTTGFGAKLPQPSTDGAFNLVWWDSTDYGDPSDDPNVEIVRCTARTNDTLTVTRAQEGTTATNKNIAGKTYYMSLDVTLKTITDIQSNFATGFYGDGSDGNVTIAAGTTTLARDMYYNNLTLATGSNLNAAGYRIFVKGTLTQQGTGKITNNTAGSGGNASGMTAGTAGSVSAGITVPVSKGGVAGAAGGNSYGTGIPGSGTAGVAAANSIGSNGITLTGASGSGGNSGHGDSGFSGGSNGTSGAATASIAAPRNYTNLEILGAYISGAYTPFSANAGNATAGGGGAGGYYSSNQSGAGSGGGSGGSGANGGWVVVYAKNIIVNAGAVLFQAVGGNGGNGGNGTNATAAYNNCGFGGGGAGALGVGGNGGVVLLFYSTKSGSITYDVSAGANGTAGTAGTGFYGSSGSGANGAVSTFTGTPIAGQTFELNF